MRKKLKEIEGKRIRVTAEVSRFGVKTAYRGYPLQTVCLVNVKDQLNNYLCDHIWLVIRKQLEELDLAVGDIISFNARSKPYIKGYRGYRDDVFDRPIEKDYRLSNPNNFVKITNTTEKEMPIIPNILFKTI